MCGLDRIEQVTHPQDAQEPSRTAAPAKRIRCGQDRRHRRLAHGRLRRQPLAGTNQGRDSIRSVASR